MKFRDFSYFILNFPKVKNGFSQCFGVIKKVQADLAPPALKQHPEAPLH